MVTDFVKAGIVINGIEEQALREHLVMHSARLDFYEKVKQEVFDVARAKSALGTASTSSSMEVDGLRRDKGKDKDKDRSKITTEGKKDSEDTDASATE